MSDFAEYTFLFSVLALAGMTIMTNVKVELWCERWLERPFMQPLAEENTSSVLTPKERRYKQLLPMDSIYGNIVVFRFIVHSIIPMTKSREPAQSGIYR